MKNPERRRVEGPCSRWADRSRRLSAQLSRVTWWMKPGLRLQLRYHRRNLEYSPGRQCSALRPFRLHIQNGQNNKSILYYSQHRSHWSDGRPDDDNNYVATWPKSQYIKYDNVHCTMTYRSHIILQGQVYDVLSPI